MQNKKFDHAGRTFEIRVAFEDGRFVVRLFEDDQQASDLMYTVGHETAVDAKMREDSLDLVTQLIELMESEVTSGRLRLKKTPREERKAALKKSLEIRSYKLLFKDVGNILHEKEVMGSLDEARNTACEMLRGGIATFIDIKDDSGSGMLITHSQIVEWCEQRGLLKK